VQIAKLLRTHRHLDNTNFRIVKILGEGSSVTLIHTQIFKHLNVKGVRLPLCLRWTNDTTHTVDASEISLLNISNKISKYKLRGVHSVDHNLPMKSLDMPHIAQRTGDSERSFNHFHLRKQLKSSSASKDTQRSTEPTHSIENPTGIDATKPIPRRVA